MLYRLMLFSLFLIFNSIVFAEDIRHSTTGFYPIWENTGHVEKGGDVKLGFLEAEVGIADRIQMGTAPVLFIYRTPNVHAKANLYSTPELNLSLQFSLFHLRDEASRSTFSPMYTSRLNNPDFSVTLLPVHLSLSQNVTPWIELHHAATLLPVFGKKLENEIFFGYSFTAETMPNKNHSIILHATEVGFWAHDFLAIGLSYRYRNKWVESRIGYFYRFRKEGNQSAPLINLAFLL